MSSNSPQDDSTTPDLSTAIESLTPNTVVPPVNIPPRGVDYRNKIVLAPMVRSGELPSRLLALHYGADLVWGPETIDRSMIGTMRRVNPRTNCIEWYRSANNNPSRESILYRIHPALESARLIYQIGTSSPATAVASASLVAPYVAGIDVNAGCPKPFSTSGGMGAALLLNPPLLCSILSSLVQEIGIPHQIGISVKIRLLETPHATSNLVHQLCQTGITGLTIHCRTTPMRPRERAIRAQLRMIAAICRSHGVACLMNGDVSSRSEALNLIPEFNVDGAMIATAAEANSSVFRPESEGGRAKWPEVVQQYLRFAMDVENKFGNTKFLLSQLMPGKDSRYQRVCMSASYSEVAEILGIVDEDLREKARITDQILRLDVPKMSKAERKAQDKAARKKRALEEGNDTNRQTENGIEAGEQQQIKKQKATLAAENSGFEGVGEGFMAVAM